jgi:hypothetical protein
MTIIKKATLRSIKKSVPFENLFAAAQSPQRGIRMPTPLKTGQLDK